MKKNRAKQKAKETLLTITGIDKEKESLSVGLYRVLRLGLLILTIAFLCAFFIITMKERRDHELKEAETYLNSVESSVLAAMDNYVEISHLILMNEDVQTFLSAEKVDKGLINDTKYSVLRILAVCNNIDSVHIFRNDMDYMKTSKSEYRVDFDRMKQPEWENLINDKKGGSVVRINGFDALFSFDGKTLMTICRVINDFNTQEKVGVLLMSIDDSLLNMILHAQKNENICILTDRGQFLAGDEDLMEHYDKGFRSEQEKSKTVWDGLRRGTIVGHKVEDLPIIVLCYSTSSLKAISWESIVCLVLLAMAFGTAMFVAGTYITRRITRPLADLTAEINRTKGAGSLENLTVKLPENEIGELADNYNDMIEHIRELISSLLEKEKTIQRAEVWALHEQIKPHFLYNSLETISAMAIDAGADDVHSALETLGSFFRNFLSKGDREIPLEREVHIIQDYLKLLKLRYGDIINDEYDISEEAKACVIPKLILQPLVENGIYHGIRMKGEPGLVKIKAYLQDENLHILVRDSGVGMPQEEIEKILRQKRTAKNEDDLNQFGFGLWGTIERVKYFCDKEDVVRIESEIGDHTEIEFIIPKDKTIRKTEETI